MWDNPLAQRREWQGTIAHRPEKQALAERVAGMVADGDVIGAGSGSTAWLALQAIGRRAREEGLRCRIVPTSREIELAASSLGLATTSLLNDRPHWCFDGADEVDGAGNMIKGRGGAFYREKLVMRAAAKSYILADRSKFVQRLGEAFPVPVEVAPEALHYVEQSVLRLDRVRDTLLRPATGKDGPVITEQGNVILDVRFDAIGPDTAMALKSLTGVLDTGLFWGFAPHILE